ncbi:MAG: right-handed parallel beta-helix repeat-containing protein [Bacteroidales bacterium]|nr:right-handed parallel beta-helix repeat-containing protein [Bacteroidales bacterium]
MKRIYQFSAVMLLFFYLHGVYAQPSGGPYGPIAVEYKIPETAKTIFYVAPDGDAARPGQDLNQPTQLDVAVSRARTGDVIVLKGGIYRTGNLRFNQGITLQPYADEKPVLKGTGVADTWTEAGGQLWFTTWENLFPAPPEDWWHMEHNIKFTPLHRFNDDMVFIDGRFLQSAGDTAEVDTNTFFIDYENKLVYIGTEPDNRLIEITNYNVALHRVPGMYKGIPNDSIGPVIQGITFTQYADTAILIPGTYPEGLTHEREYGNDVVGTLLENCEVSWCSRIGAYLMGDSLTIRNCKVSHTSTEGIYLVGASDALIENTIISDNNIEHLTGYFPAAVKIFNQSYRVTCRNNLLTDLPNSNGVWYDVGNVDGVFINNWVENVGDASKEKYSSFQNMSGFFVEISKGAVCAGNVFLNCDNGSFVLNSSKVEFYQNTYINSKVVFARTERSAANDHFGWHPATGPDVDERYGHVFFSNLVFQDGSKKDPILEVWQAPPLCESLNTLQLEKFDHNVYVRTTNSNDPLFIWSGIGKSNCRLELNSLTELHALDPDYAKHSKVFDGFQELVFLDAGKLNFRLDPEFRKKISPVLPSKKIQELLMIDLENPYTGAYSD